MKLVCRRNVAKFGSWARKALEHCKQRLKDHSGGSFEGYSMERNVDNGGLAHEVSEQNKDSLGNEPRGHVCDILVTFNPCPEN